MSDHVRVRTRYAPSPTGRQHVGGARSAIFPWLWARHNKGDFILRIEDTDQTRFRKDALQDLFETFEWLGLDFDEGPDGADAPPNEYFQTQRKPRYKEVADQLLELGAAYYCYCTSERLIQLRAEQDARKQPTGYDRHCRFMTEEEQAAAAAACAAEGRVPVIRFKVPLEGKTRVKDAVRDELVSDNKGLEDMILLKSDGLPTYHLGHFVDDHDMQVTHVMRGVEYIPTAPLHQMMHDAIGWETPIYAHLPLILDPSGKGKMSKRKQDEKKKEEEEPEEDYLVMVHEFREAGYLPEAMFNYVALLGWSVSPDRDLAGVEEMIEKFDVADIKKSNAAFNYEKLLYMNGYYMRQLAVDDLARRVVPFLEAAGLPTDHERLVEVLPLVQERMKLLTEAPELLDFFLADAPLPKVQDLPGRKKKKQKMDIPSTIAALKGAHAALADCEWSMDGIQQALKSKMKEIKLKAGQLYHPIRVAITGRTQAPGIFETIYHVGRETVLVRLERAITLLEAEL